ncbi:permease [Vibrio mediterranei]
MKKLKELLSRSWIIKFLRKLLRIDKETLQAIGEDMRGIGKTAIGVGLVALIVSGDTINNGEALLVFSAGLVVWFYGILITRTSNA